jgi:hypothetical protein
MDHHDPGAGTDAGAGAGGAGAGTGAADGATGSRARAPRARGAGRCASCASPLPSEATCCWECSYPYVLRVRPRGGPPA